MNFKEMINNSKLNIEEPEKPQKTLDHTKKTEKKELEKKLNQTKRGRKNRGLTEKHYNEYKDTKREFNHIIQPLKFNDEIIERVNGEIVLNDDLNEFKELYLTTCYSVYEDFKKENSELVKHNVYTWYKRVLINIKKNVPEVSIDEIDKLIVVWECLKEFLNYIGLYITFETFQDMTKIYKYQLEKRAELNSKYDEFLKKIYIDRDNALLNELQFNGYTQQNKMFIAKTHGIIEKTEPRQIEIHHEIRNYNNLPMFEDPNND